MNKIRVISFDAEGTLVSPDFSDAIWHEAIPALYAQKKGVNINQAKTTVFKEYDKVGDQRLEWYDIGYWFRLLELGTPDQVIQDCLDKAVYYTEVTEVLSDLAGRYELIVASSTHLDFLNYILRDIKHYFSHIFSSISHYKQVKSTNFYLEICKTVNVSPSEVVHVGDNWRLDFLVPKQAGMHAYYLDRSGGNHHESLADLRQFLSLLPS